MINRAFIVDDEVVNRIVAKYYFDRNMPVKYLEQFDNGYDALDRYLDLIATGNPPPELILLDIMMPVMNGFQFLEQLLPYNTTSKVVMISSSIHVDDKKRAFTFPSVKLYIDKPMEKPKFQQIIELMGEETHKSSAP